MCDATTTRIAIAHLFFTAGMVGLMTMVQLVVYPQYDQVAIADFSSYVANHGDRIGIPLILLAPFEMLAAAALWHRLPSGKTKNLAFGAGAILAAAWVATALWFGPSHGRLISDPYDPANIDLLTNTNWFRTLAWWVRGLLAVIIIDRITSTKTTVSATPTTEAVIG